MIFVTVLEDSAALVGLAIAATGLTLSHLLRAPSIDAAASILIGVVLMVEASLLGFECRGLIIGEAARPLVIAEVRRVAAQHPEMGRIDELRTLQLGADSVRLVLGVSLEPAMNAGEVQRARAKLAADLRHSVPAIKYVVYDPEPGRRLPGLG